MFPVENKINGLSGACVLSQLVKCFCLLSLNVLNVVLAQLESVMLMALGIELGKLNSAPRQGVIQSESGENYGTIPNPEGDMLFSYQQQGTFLDFISVFAAALYLCGIVVLWVSLDLVRYSGPSQLSFHVFLAGGVLACFGFVVSTLYLLFSKE